MKYIRNNELMTADMAGETVMLDAKSGNYYALGDSGSAIWTLLAQPMDLDELASALMEQYDVEAEKCKEDIIPFLQNLLEKDLIKYYEPLSETIHETVI